MVILAVRFLKYFVLLSPNTNSQKISILLTSTISGCLFLNAYHPDIWPERLKVVRSQLPQTRSEGNTPISLCRLWGIFELKEWMQSTCKGIPNLHQFWVFDGRNNPVEPQNSQFDESKQKSHPIKGYQQSPSLPTDLERTESFCICRSCHY